MSTLNIPADLRWAHAWRNLRDPERLLRERPTLADTPLMKLAALWREFVGERDFVAVVHSFAERHRLTVEQALQELHAAILNRLTVSDEQSGLVRADDFPKRFRIERPDELAGPAQLLGASVADLPPGHWIRDSIDQFYDFHGAPAVIFGPGLSHAPTTPRAFYGIEAVSRWTRELGAIQREQRRIAQRSEEQQRDRERIALENDPRMVRRQLTELQLQVAALTEQLQKG